MKSSDDNTTVFYTLSNRGRMVEDLYKSLSGVMQYIAKDDIFIAITPPWLKERDTKFLHYEGFNWELSKNYSPPEERYMEKLYQIRQYSDKLKENLIFLDCDTEINKSPLLLLQGDFDFSARVGVATIDFDYQNYVNLQKDYIMYPMFNSGVMVFKNYSYKEIVNNAINFYEEHGDIRLGVDNYPDQLALMFGLLKDKELAFKVKYMTKKEHGFRWLCEPHNTIVYHGTRRKPFRKLLMKLLEFYRYIS